MYNSRQNKLSCGPRILTFFLYLSDVEEGGETVFPSLNISVSPKRGRALLWPSTMDHDLELQDGNYIYCIYICVCERNRDRKYYIVVVVVVVVYLMMSL